MNRRDESRRPPRQCLGGTPLSGVSLRPNGRTPPGSRYDFQTGGPPPFSGSAQLTAFGRHHHSSVILGFARVTSGRYASPNLSHPARKRLRQSAPCPRAMWRWQGADTRLRCAVISTPSVRCWIPRSDGTAGIRARRALAGTENRRFSSCARHGCVRDQVSAVALVVESEAPTAAPVAED